MTRNHRHQNRQRPAYSDKLHLCGNCARVVTDKRADGHYFATCAVCRTPQRPEKYNRTDASRPLALDDLIECVKCGKSVSLREMAYGVDGKPSHRSTHSW